MGKINGQGLVPPFIRRAIVSPGVGLGVLVIAAVATIPFWHLSSPDVAGMASRQLSGMQSTGAAVADDKPEAPDPSPLSVADVTTQAAPAKRAVRPVASPSPFAGVQSVAVAQSVAVSQPPQAPPQPSPPTAEPRPPADTHSVFGEPSDTELDPSKASATAPVPARYDAPQVVAQSSGGVGYVPATSRYELQQGGIIHARFTSHIDAEHPGQVEGITIEPVYASADPQVEIIPSGAQVVGSYSTTATGDTRLLITWTRLNLPSGQKFAFAEPGTDEMGSSGVGGTVNTHAGKALAQAALSTILSSAGNAFTRSNTVVVGGSFAQVQQPQQVKPDIYVDAGAKFDIVAGRDLPFEAYEAAR